MSEGADMLNPFSLFSFLAGAIFYHTWSLVPGAVVGLVAGFLVTRQRFYTGLAAAGILLVLAPKIGVDTMLVKSADLAIKLNVFLFGIALAMLLTLVWRHWILTDPPESKTEPSLPQSTGGEV
ncbi:MAG: hypothetical protein P1R58_09060 [bacterium]|nr:hypothetical protein [bacterium]